MDIISCLWKYTVNRGSNGNQWKEIEANGMIKYVLKDYKTIFNKYKFIDSWFWCRYSINPYNGCQFAGTYCDSRSHKYHLHPEFDHLIYIKGNI